MVTRQFGQYGHVVILMQADAPHRPVPFGVFNSHEEAEEWAQTELTLHEGDTYYVNYVRDVVPSDENGQSAATQRLAHDIRDLLDDYGAMPVKDIVFTFTNTSRSDVARAVSYGDMQGFLHVSDNFLVSSLAPDGSRKRSEEFKRGCDELVSRLNKIEDTLPNGL